MCVMTFIIQAGDNYFVANCHVTVHDDGASFTNYVIGDQNLLFESWEVGQLLGGN